MSERSIEKIDPGNYTLELKYDGWRAIVMTVNGKVSLWTREKVRIDMPMNLESQLKTLSLPDDTVLDGEIWNPLKRGSWKHSNQVECKITLWDVVRAGGQDMSTKPIESRRARLQQLLRGGSEDINQVQILTACKQTFDNAFAETKNFREENALRSGFIHGVVLKRNGSPRRDHATRCVEHPDWLKIVFTGMSGWEHRG